MKRFLANITSAFAALLLLGGCNEFMLEDPGLGQEVESGEGLITLTLMNGSFPTRAASDLEDYERAVHHIDVIIFENGTDGKPGAWAFNARKDAANLEGQKIVLGKRTDFLDKEYWIYVIANHTSADGSEFNSSNCPNFLTFCHKTAENELVFLTGHGKMGEVEFPQYFLMDGVAYDTASPPVKDEKGELEYSAVNLNSSELEATKDVFLKVDLKRAAAKIVVNISEKARDTENPYDNYVEFTGKGSIQTPSDGKNPDDLITSGFYFRELPYSTSLIADSRYATMGVGHTAKRRNTVKYNGDRFNYSSDNSRIKITAYAYARDWSDLDAILSTTIVANIPMESYEYSTVHYVDGEDVLWSADTGTDNQVHATLTDDLGNKLTYRKDFHVKDDTGKDVAVTGWFGWSKEVLPANYYQIPVSQTKMLKRNGYYEVSLSISIPGGSDPGEPVELEKVSYKVYDWEEETITIGNSTEKPVYLAVNEEEFEMYNMSTDSQTLEFASSSELKSVSASSISVYYYNKYGNKTTVSSSTHGVTVTPAAGMSGNITVYSPLPDNNTIRYIEFEVENQDGLKKKITVRQYPLVYITNIQSWYSYRSDFTNNGAHVPTTFQNMSSSNRIDGVAYRENSNSYDYSGEYNEFWNSKVAYPNTDGTSSIRTYYWSDGGFFQSAGKRETEREEDGNGKMYHVRVTSSSQQYILGAPRMTKPEDDKTYGLSYTDPGEDNKKMVSPAFMIASRLGFFWSDYVELDPTENTNALSVARHHCANYVEVYKDANGNPIHLYDWRLPTEEELKIIMNIQGKKGETAASIDYLLNANFYYSASGPVFNTKNDDGNSVGDYGSTSVRCIRDAFTTVPDQTQIPGF